MATYFHGSSELQGEIVASDEMQTIYLMNPNYVSFSDTHQPATATNMFYLNHAGNALNPTSLPHAPPSNHYQFLDLPLPSPTPPMGPSSLDDPNRPSSLVSDVCHKLWGPTINEQQNSPPESSSNPQLVSVASTGDTFGGPHDVDSQLGLRRSGVSPRQGLSLSLSSLQVPYRPSNVETVIRGQPDLPTTILAADDMKIPGSSPSIVSAVSNGISGVQSVVFGSKYLRAAQELLDEVVKVGLGLKADPSDGTKEKIKVNKETKDDVTAAGGEGSSIRENGDKARPELTTVQRQELQMKKAKLVSMLDEVEQRYRQYHHQMQAVVVSFEQAAGFGAAKAYTSLALRTISKQFRCLKDAICGQINATSKRLGEEDSSGAKIEGSRLRYVDHQLRQQRALQQLGMIQHNNAWRPQRGLPERAVSVLRAWLFEHFLHPYPKVSDKHMLAKQTGLTRSQVSNWFINARVRLWKPMVEEMYKEEVKEQQERTNGSEEITKSNKSDQKKESGSSSSAHTMDQVKAQAKPKSIHQNNNNTSSTDQFSNSTISTSAMRAGSLLQQTSPLNLARPSDHDMQNSPMGILPMEMDMKQGEPREINMKLGDERLFRDSYSYLSGSVYGAMREIERLNADQQQLPPGFNGNSGVSLTLGLPHSENLSLSGNRQNFVSNQLGGRLSESDIYGINTQQPASHPGDLELQNRKRFAAPLLPDFVA